MTLSRIGGVAPDAKAPARILGELRRRGESTRVELAGALDLSPATISTTIADLLDRDLILETRAAQGAGRGRPRQVLALNADARHVAGAKLNAAALTVSILNFRGHVLAETSAPIDDARVSAAGLTDRLETALRRLLAETRLGLEDIASVGLGVPGFVELQSGLCHWSPILEGAPIDVRAHVADRLGRPVFVDNDANLATLAELWFGDGRNARNFLVVTIEHGVGLGVVIDGALFRGARGLGAEFGHTKIAVDGALCRCGQRGCLEAYVADYALHREAGAALGPMLNSAAPDDMLDALARRANEGHGLAAAIYQRAGRFLGVGLANLMNLFDPELIILAGERVPAHPLLADAMRKAVDEAALSLGRAPTPITIHNWGDDLWARGAGALALDGLAARA